MTPPAMRPAFELCRPKGTDVLALEDPAVEAEEVEAETEADELDAPSTVSGPSSGESTEEAKDTGVRLQWGE